MTEPEENLSEDMTDQIEAVLDANAVGQRLDKALASALPDLSRARIQQLMAGGQVMTMAGDALTNPSAKVTGAATILVTLPPAQEAQPKPENIPLNIVFEDEHLLVLDKPAGLVVHPAAGHATGTLVNALLYHCGESLSGIGGVRRPGIVHRLDKETSGLMVVAKHDQAHHGLAAQFADRTLSRQYQALVWGQPKPQSGHIAGAIARHPQQRKKMTVVDTGGKHAVTHYETIQTFGRVATQIDCRLETGRTHQIRVHLASIGHPLIGDETYGNTRFSRRQRAMLPDEIKHLIPVNRQALHAYSLQFEHPITKASATYTSPLPRDITLLIDQLLTM